MTDGAKHRGDGTSPIAARRGRDMLGRMIWHRRSTPVAPDRCQSRATARRRLPGVALAAFLGLTACAGTDTGIDPTAPILGTPRPASSQDWPNLSIVPPRPADLPSPAQRYQILREMEQDRDALRGGAAAP